jgi:hypothetical protein
MRAKHLKMASSMNMDSDDEELLRPSIGTKTWNITPDMVESVLAVCPHASREAIKCDLNQTNSVTTTINRILDGEVRTYGFNTTTGSVVVEKIRVKIAMF